MVLILGSDRQAHPGMNTALEAGDFTMVECSAGASSGRNENVVRTGWLWAQVSVHHLSTFRRRSQIARRRIQKCDKTTAKSLHAGKCMRFASQTLKIECGALFHFGVVRSESPCADRFVCPKLCEETRERDRSVGGIAGAGAPGLGRESQSSGGSIARPQVSRNFAPNHRECVLPDGRPGTQGPDQEHHVVCSTV